MAPGRGIRVGTLFLALFGTAASFITTCLAILLLSRFAPSLRLIDRPGGRKQHHAPTPVVGGLGMVVGGLVGGTSLAFTLPGLPPQVAGLVAAGAIVLTVSVADDVWDVPWQIRLSSQVFAALAMIYIGGVRIEQIGEVFGLQPFALGVLSTPLTILATVGLINAVNMSDGVDGLAGFLGFAAMLMLASAAAYSGNLVLLGGLAVLAASTAAFLVFNMRWPWQSNARVFMGNTGSALLGLVLAWSMFRLTQAPEFPVSPILCPFFLLPPVVDCLTLMSRRMLHGRSPFAADRRHMHHLLLDSGFRHSEVVILLGGLSLASGLLAAYAYRQGLPGPVFVVAFAVTAGAYFQFTRNWGRAVRLLAAGRVLGGGAPLAALQVTTDEVKRLAESERLVPAQIVRNDTSRLP
jgi:UDP-GlcNAc:undecaprenyl-phosphate GlcNAc-1-phosphate transferase